MPYLENIENTENSTPTAILNITQDGAVNAPQTGLVDDCGSSVPLLSESEKYLAKIISGLVNEVKELKKQINGLENRIILSNTNRSSSVNTGFNNANKEINNNIMSMLPARSMADFMKLEGIISNSEEAYTLLVDVLYLVGGADYKESVYACMRKLHNADVANGYSTYGKLRGGKKKQVFLY